MVGNRAADALLAILEIAPHLKRAEMRALSWFARRVIDTGSATVTASLSEQVRGCGMGRKYVVAANQSLRDRQLLTWEPGDRIRPNCYRVRVMELWFPAEVVSVGPLPQRVGNSAEVPQGAESESLAGIGQKGNYPPQGWFQKETTLRALLLKAKDLAG
jgi:hypothetical protein